MFCRRCGKKLKENDNYCDGCGIKVLEKPTLISETKEIEFINEENGGLALGIVLGALMFSFGMILLVSLITKNII